MSWTDWATAVCWRIGAPVDSVNIDTLWAWSNAETAPYDLMRWNNPLNTTWHLPGSINSGAQPGAHDVQIYATIEDGVEATALTLLQQGYYPTIVSHLRNSVPRQQWADACGQLSKWGTGCGWLDNYYGAAPGVLEAEMTPEEHGWLEEVYKELRGNGQFANLDQIMGTQPGLAASLPELLKAIQAVQVAGGLTQQQVTDAMTAALKTLTLKAQ